jgi:ribosomal protein S18 acetylase RimI-like enzyme
MEIQVRRVANDEIDAALAALLVDSGEGGVLADEKVRNFKRVGIRRPEELSQQIVVNCAGKIVFSCLFVAQPGRTAFVFVGSCRRMRSLGLTDTAPAGEAVGELCRWAFREGCTFLQVILDPADREGVDLCESIGFTRLTDLVYLLLPIGPADNSEAGNEDIEWEAYGPGRHEVFKQVIERSYEQSLDCPELEGLRDIEDVLKGHMGVGEFDPDGWRLMKYQGQPAGVVLLARQPRTEVIELVYMGVTPEYRGRGFGGDLLTEAIRWTRYHGVQCIMLAVDCRNSPAYELYKRYGFSPLFRRVVLIRSCHPTGQP